MQKISAMSAAFSVMLAAPLLMVSPAPARADVDFQGAVSLGFHVGDADVGVFYDSLAPYGDWVQTDRYGLCWAPRVAEQDWRPYYYGHWVYTDYGWTWVSDEEWGWGPYHYGRWAFDPAYGWIWVPGSVWAPAWVAWRWGDGYTGWAPLPPDVDPSLGPSDWGIDPLSFVFVPDRYVTEPVLRDRYVPPARNVTIVNVTRNVTNYTVVNNQVVNQGVPVQQVERVTGRAVPRVHVAEQTRPARTQVRGNEVAIYKPAVPKASATPTRPRTATQPRSPAGTQQPSTAPQHPTGPTTATQRPPAAAPPATTDPAELKRKQAQEQQALQAKEAQEREKLRQIHEQEKTAPPPNVSSQQLEKQHQEEQRAQAEHEQRQKQALEQRQARERQAAQQAQQQRQAHPQGQNEKQKNDKDKKKPESKQQ